MYGFFSIGQKGIFLKYMELIKEIIDLTADVKFLLFFLIMKCPALSGNKN